MNRRSSLTALLLLTAALQTLRAGTIVVQSTADSGTGSLRQAIFDARSGDTINITANGEISQVPVVDEEGPPGRHSR